MGIIKFKIECNEMGMCADPEDGSQIHLTRQLTEAEGVALVGIALFDMECDWPEAPFEEGGRCWLNFDKLDEATAKAVDDFLNGLE